MGNTIKKEDDFFIKNLLEVVKTRELSEEETDRLEELFIEAFGYLPTNLCLHPQWLMNKWQHNTNEDDEVEKWYQQENISFIDEEPLELKELDITFMCESPDNCYSFQKHNFACGCIRKHFSRPSEFRLWAENELNELKEQLTDFLPKGN
jgi:hypothetical protein